VHTLLGLSSTLLVLLGSYLLLGLLRGIGSWSQRRGVQEFVLLVPILSLGLGLGGLHHFVGRPCLSRAPSWDSLLGVTLPLAMGLVALGAVGLSLLRLMLMGRVVARRGVQTSPAIQSLADDLAGRLGAVRPRVLFCAYDRPLAFTSGLFRPTILLSTWMVEHLDRRELEAVLAHELEHVARRDYLVIWLATMLRDAFFYIPTSWTAYRQLQHEKELACDDTVVGTTQRPLALASALAKVRLQALEGPGLARGGTTQHLVGVDKSINGRIERLLAAQGTTANTPRLRLGALRISISALVGLLVLEVVTVILILASMGCGPLLLLEKLF
jgi:beta-lactamase regulating signal transducer with metallopeptidase domain